MNADPDNGKWIESDALMASLSALPLRAPDPIAAERVRLRARLELRRRPRSRLLRAFGRGWYLAEPWVGGATVVVFLVWTFDRMSLLLG